MENVSSKQIAKQILIFIIISIFVFDPKLGVATDFAITFNVSHYQNGNNISCNGAHDGMVEAVIVGGVSPYSYSWNTGSYNRVLTGLGAGTYTFTVTDGANQTISANVELIQPAVLQLGFIASEYGGYNISEQGGHDGFIETQIKGGSQPYSFAWSNSSLEIKIGELTAGSYSVVITDANGCTVSKSKTLTEPTPLHVVSLTSPQHHGFNISCKGGHDGQIDLTVDGGVPPYKYDWNTGSFDEDISDLSAGEYSVRITDGNNAEIVESIQLTQPASGLKATLTSQLYGNGFNLSCHDCANGSATVIGSGGVAPYTYLWSNFQTSSTISGLQANEYTCTISDINGCTAVERITLHSPDRDDWSMFGNSNTNPSSQFIGTTDNHDVVFKTNNIQRMSISSVGNIVINHGMTVDSLNVGSRLLLNGKYAIGYQGASGNFPEIFSFGKLPTNNTFSVSSCTTPVLNSLPNYQFGGSIQLYGNSVVGGNLNVMELGFDGANSIIDATGTSSDPNSNRLLINYYCGKDVFVGNVLSGDLTANRNFFTLGKVGVHTRNPMDDLDVKGGITSSIDQNTYIRLWHDGGSARLSNYGIGQLNINYDNNSNVNVCTGTSTGNFTTGGNAFLAADRGKVGIANSHPHESLEIGDNFTFHSDLDSKWIGYNLSYNAALNTYERIVDGSCSRIAFDPNGCIKIETFGNQLAGAPFAFWLPRLTVNQDGIVMIGTCTPNLTFGSFKLYVRDGIRTEKIRVDIASDNNWSDYIFEDSHRLMPLSQLEMYICENKHLPEVPTTAEVVKNGIDLAQMDATLLAKVEELTLYLIELKKEIEKLKGK